jgi:hypothetical protein
MFMMCLLGPGLALLLLALQGSISRSMASMPHGLMAIVVGVAALLLQSHLVDAGKLDMDACMSVAAGLTPT